jgi:uncharacterized protein (TIGR00251 family)
VIRETSSGVELDVRVIPRAGKTACAGVRDGALLIRVAAPPVEGAANEALIAYFSATFRIPKHAVQIVSGERTRRKRVAIAGVTVEQVRGLGDWGRGE